MDEWRIGSARVVLLRGDITEQAADAIVNAANSTLLGGGGVDGAIHRRGGPVILEECRALRRSRYPNGLPPGGAVITSAGSLPARHVIHTVGPVWRGGSEGEAEVLAAAYRSSLTLAAEHGLRSIAFPAISTGAYGYPVEQAAAIALRTTHQTVEADPASFDEIRFVLFSEADLQIYRSTASSVL